jgi:hypothetical protein
MVKKHEGVTYLFAVAMRERTTNVTFKAHGLAGEETVQVLGEDRTITSKDGVFKDGFGAWDVHLYRIAGKNAG